MHRKEEYLHLEGLIPSEETMLFSSIEQVRNVNISIKMCRQIILYISTQLFFFVRID